VKLTILWNCRIFFTFLYEYFRERERGKADASFYIGLRGGKRQYISYREDFKGSITQINNSNSGSWID